MSGLQGTNWF